MLYKFRKVNNPSEVIEYDQEHNILVLDGQPFYNEELPSDHIEEFARKLTKVRNPKVLKVKLGHDCNMACSYCLQEPLGDKNNKGKAQVDGLIKELDKSLDLSELEGLELWGGEPLLYWEALEQLLDKYDREGLTITIVSNGLLFTNKIVNKIKSLKAHVSIGLSHDGPKHKEIRGQCWIEKRADKILELHKAENTTVGIACTLTEHNCDVVAIERWFRERLQGLGFFEPGKPNVMINMEPVKAYDELSKATTINKNLKTFGESIKRIVQMGRVSMDVMPNTYINGPHGVGKLVESLRYKNLLSAHYGCGVDLSNVLSVDINGNVIACQNVSASDLPSGNINDLDAVKVAGVHINTKSKCEECPYLRVCQRGCPLTGEQSLYTTMNCKVDYKQGEAVILSTLEELFGEPFEPMFDSYIDVRPLPEAIEIVQLT